MLQQLTNGLGAAAVAVGLFIPKLIGFLVVLVIGWIVAKAIEGAVRGILHRTGFNRLVERGGIKQALSRSKYDASELLARIAYYATMLFVLQFAFGAFGANPVSAVLTGVIAYLPRVFAAGLIVVIGAAVAAFAREAIDAIMGGLSYGRAVAGFAAGAILFVTAFMALDELAIATSIVTGLFYASLAAVAGTIIVAAGGGGIPIMTDWWRRASNRVEAEAPAIKEQTQGASERVKGRAEERMQQAKQATGQPSETEQGRVPVGTGSRTMGTGGGTGGDTTPKR
jgi:hypothetical protein